MIKIVTSQEMRQMDQFTIEELGIPGVVLMENAGKGTFHIIQTLIQDINALQIQIFCGKGNNGGDGFVIGRYLWDSGAQVQFYITGEENDLKGDARINYEIIKKCKLPVTFLKQKSDLSKIVSPDADIVVDALLGTGITGEVYGFTKEVIEFINRSSSFVVAVDVPSGLNSDLPVVEGTAVEADVTVTMALPKHCHVFYPARSYVGDLYIADIGIPAFKRHSEEVKIQRVEQDDIKLPLRFPDSHKYKNGKVAVLAGSIGYTGAAYLTSEAAMRIGAGLVILGIPQELNVIMETKLTEVITKPYSGQTFHSSKDPAVTELLEWCDILALGPGLGRSVQTQQAIIELLSDFKKPVVVDADALFALSLFPEVLKRMGSDWILTPHVGEFQRLLQNIRKEKLSTEFVKLAQEFAMEHKVVLLLKGAPSLVASPQGEVFVNSTGNAGLASGGTGDVLTGFVAGLLAQGMKPVEAAYTANYLHGQCADELVKTISPQSLLAGDLLGCITDILHQYSQTI